MKISLNSIFQFLAKKFAKILYSIPTLLIRNTASTLFP